MKRQPFIFLAIAGTVAGTSATAFAAPLGTAFTDQGQLIDTGPPPTATTTRALQTSTHGH